MKSCEQVNEAIINRVGVRASVPVRNAALAQAQWSCGVRPLHWERESAVDLGLSLCFWDFIHLSPDRFLSAHAREVYIVHCECRVSPTLFF